MIGKAQLLSKYSLRAIDVTRVKTLRYLHQTQQDIKKSFTHLSTKELELTGSQQFFNATMGRVPGFELIGDKPCGQTLVLDTVATFLKQKTFVQVPRCCMFEIGLIIDLYSTGKSDFFSSLKTKGLTSLTKNEGHNRAHDAVDTNFSTT